jgi:hypothetical protein
MRESGKRRGKGFNDLILKKVVGVIIDLLRPVEKKYDCNEVQNNLINNYRQVIKVY